MLTSSSPVRSRVLLLALMPAISFAEIKLIDVPAGEFQMGNAEPSMSRDKCFYEQPVHSVRITQAFRMSVTEVTVEQYREFKSDFVTTKGTEPYATGMNWHDTKAFCEWLSQKEGKPYRLATEAEWEYTARNAEKLGLQNMLSGPLEWCADWFGEYPMDSQGDPVGPASGFVKVVRGGCLDEPGDMGKVFNFNAADYAHATHRSGMAPRFGGIASSALEHGRHHIGFRVVQAPMLTTKPSTGVERFVQQGVKDTRELARRPIDQTKPYLRKRLLLPVPPDNAPISANDALGLHPSFRAHNHSPALTVCPNGDVLMVIYASLREYEPEVSLMACRLRFGAEEWDEPEPFIDFPTVNDHAPLLFTDGEVTRLFWGSGYLAGAFPFQWIESRDSGATWSQVKFPRITNKPGSYTCQPVNSAFRDAKGTIYIANDGGGSTALLWATDDDGKTWRDTGGRSEGRHTTFAPLINSRILGMGGKSSNINGFMPQVVSSDGGVTYTKSACVFPALGRNQRPTLLRLQSGRLFFAGDFQDNYKGLKPASETRSGCYVALSGDDGKTWTIKKLQSTQVHEGERLNKDKSDTLGYAVAAQAPNGTIHLITSMNHPCLHFELNEAWILSPDANDVLLHSSAMRMTDVNEHRKDPRETWSGGLADDGRFYLHGTETRFDTSGRKQYEAMYRRGKKVGRETQWRSDGSIAWQWDWRSPADGRRLQIMPMGDSITQGTGAGNCGYRYDLYRLLKASGCDFDFVGRKHVPGDITPDADHWGSSGWQISGTNVQVAGKSYTSLQGSPRPGIFEEMKDAITSAHFSTSAEVRNVILLMIGVNDHLHQVVDNEHREPSSIADGCIARLQALLTEINTHATTQRLRLEVIVGTIPKLSTEWKGDPVSEVIVQQGLRYNEWIRTHLPEMKFLQLSIQVVDTEAALAGKLADFVHPNAAGYEAMAHTWHDAITGTNTFTQFWSNGQKKSESHWRGRFAEGLALRFTPEGKEESRVQFVHGEMKTTPATKPNDNTTKPGAFCYYDRAFTITALPKELLGGLLVRTANNDDFATAPNHLPLDLTNDSTLYVCYWAEASELPTWLKQPDWKRLNEHALVKIGNTDKAYNIFARSVPKGHITLGGNDRKHTHAISNYFVVVKTH